MDTCMMPTAATSSLSWTRPRASTVFVGMILANPFQVTQPPARLAELSKHVEDFFDLVVDAVRVYDNILATNPDQKEITMCVRKKCAMHKDAFKCRPTIWPMLS